MSLPPGLLVSFYGDDFTGSTDTMEALAKAGLRTVLFLDPPPPGALAQFEGLRAVGVAGVSRSLSPAEMDGELPPIFERLHALNAPLFHGKVCSTFDSSPHIGSIGRTLEIGQRVFHSPFVPLVVGAPILNRFCLFGHLFARSGPESEVFRLDRHPTMSRHPVTPMDESDLRIHLGRQTERSIGLVDVLQLAGGVPHCAVQIETLLQEGCAGVLFDTLTQGHLAAIGQLLWERARAMPPLFALGSSGVEYALTAFWQEQGWLPAPPRWEAAPVNQMVVVSGSCSPVTARQIDRASADGFDTVAIDPIRLLEADGAGEPWEALLNRALPALQQGRSIILHACRGPEDPRLAATREWIARTGRPSDTRRLGSLLGRLLRDLLERSEVRRAVVTGGDTSGYAARELGIRALETVAPFAPGSPLCRIHSENPRMDGVEILFKGGQVGPVDLFSRILNGTIRN